LPLVALHGPVRTPREGLDWQPLAAFYRLRPGRARPWCRCGASADIRAYLASDLIDV
jgi:hypothetical protein